MNYQNFSGETALHASCIWRGGEIEEFREEILAAGANPNLPNKYGDLALKITQMVAHGADINYQDNDHHTALYYAKQSGKTEAADYLIERKGQE